jgi:2-polyprenyl-3-methyl-5-hydroxy-6-metoxy-1,4-benzoquinol methylase
MKIIQKNKPELWDKIWQDGASAQKDKFNLLKEGNSIRWMRIKKILLNEFNSFKNLKVIEIGAGAGTYGALMAKMGANVTILDYSERALQRAKQFFSTNNLSAEFVKQNALSLPIKYLNQYDVSMSFGLAEHFKGKSRIKINKAHFDVLKKNGIAFISVPNKYNLPYRVFKFAAELSSLWRVGEEYPYSRKEFAQICAQIGIKKYSFIGDSFYASFKFINPVHAIAKKIGKKDKFKNIKIEKGCFLDQYISYALVLYGKK